MIDGGILELGALGAMAFLGYRWLMKHSSRLTTIIENHLKHSLEATEANTAAQLKAVEVQTKVAETLEALDRAVVSLATEVRVHQESVRPQSEAFDLAREHRA